MIYYHSLWITLSNKNFISDDLNGVLGYILGAGFKLDHIFLAHLGFSLLNTQ